MSSLPTLPRIFRLRSHPSQSPGLFKTLRYYGKIRQSAWYRKKVRNSYMDLIYNFCINKRLLYNFCIDDFCSIYRQQHKYRRKPDITYGYSNPLTIPFLYTKPRQRSIIQEMYIYYSAIRILYDWDIAESSPVNLPENTPIGGRDKKIHFLLGYTWHDERSIVKGVSCGAVRSDSEVPFTMRSESCILSPAERTTSKPRDMASHSLSQQPELRQ